MNFEKYASSSGFDFTFICRGGDLYLPSVKINFTPVLDLISSQTGIDPKFKIIPADYRIEIMKRILYELDPENKKNPQKINQDETPEHIVELYEAAEHFNVTSLQNKCIEHMLQYPHMAYLKLNLKERKPLLDSLLEQNKISNPTSELIMEMVLKCDNSSKALTLFGQFNLPIPEKLIQCMEISDLNDVYYILKHIYGKHPILDTLQLISYQSDVEDSPPGSPSKRKRDH